LLGLERCQWRLARIVRNHIGCAILTGEFVCGRQRAMFVERDAFHCGFLSLDRADNHVWIRLKQVAHETAQIIYQVKHGPLSEYCGNN